MIILLKCKRKTNSIVYISSGVVCLGIIIGFVYYMYSKKHKNNINANLNQEEVNSPQIEEIMDASGIKIPNNIQNEQFQTNNNLPFQSQNNNNNNNNSQENFEEIQINNNENQIPNNNIIQIPNKNVFKNKFDQTSENIKKNIEKLNNRLKWLASKANTEYKQTPEDLEAEEIALKIYISTKSVAKFDIKSINNIKNITYPYNLLTREEEKNFNDIITNQKNNQKSSINSYQTNMDRVTTRSDYFFNKILNKNKYIDFNIEDRDYNEKNSKDQYLNCINLFINSQNLSNDELDQEINRETIKNLKKYEQKKNNYETITKQIEGFKIQSITQTTNTKQKNLLCKNQFDINTIKEIIQKMNKANNLKELQTNQDNNEEQKNEIQKQTGNLQNNTMELNNEEIQLQDPTKDFCFFSILIKIKFDKSV